MHNVKDIRNILAELCILAGYMFIVFFQKVVKVSGASRNLKGRSFKNELILA
jgi:hypothetical protein